MVAQALPDHSVQFYDTDDGLCEVVVDFAAAGLIAGEPLVVIASEAHNALFTDGLRERGLPVDAAVANGQMLVLDAGETLARIMDGDEPDRGRFERVIGGTIERCGNGRPVRAYGEMVDLLWQRGRTPAALRLEDYWNDLGRRLPFQLLCAYVMGPAFKEQGAADLSGICQAHRRHAAPPSHQRLAREIDHRREVERALRESLAVEQAAREEARLAARKKDEFLAVLGHELRNPLAPILTALQLMKLRGAGCDRERRVIERQVRYLGRLVDDLLDVARITKAQIELKREPVEVGPVVARAIELASPVFEQRGHTLEIDVAPRGLMVDADPLRLAQVLSNLLTNAGKYTDPRGVIQIAARRDGADVAVAVKDNGVGIDPEILPRIFELFVQAERVLDRSQGGLGIGLTIARSLIEAHGGRIVARSGGLGQGSEFEIRLPAVTAVPVVTIAELSDPRLSAGRAGARVMVVDDNVDAAEMLAEALRAVGHEVAVAHDGPQALVIARAFSPEAALLDIGLPVMDGYELARKLRILPRPPRRLLAVSGYGQEPDKARSLEVGFDVHLVKPIELAEVIRLLDAME